MQIDFKAQIIGAIDSILIVFLFKFGHSLISHTHNLSKTQQPEKMSACECKKNALLVTSVLEIMRNEDSFNDFHNVIVQNTKTNDFIENPVTKRKINAPKYSLLQFVEGHNSKELSSHPVITRDLYLGIFYEALDALRIFMKDRFNQPSFIA